MIRHLRVRLGRLTQDDLGALLGFNRVTIWGWEQDRAKPSTYVDGLLRLLWKASPAANVDRSIAAEGGPVALARLLALAVAPS